MRHPQIWCLMRALLLVCTWPSSPGALTGWTAEREGRQRELCCLFVPGAISMAPPCPQAWCDAKSKVSFSNRNRNQVTIILRRVPVITRDKEYVTYSDGPGFASSTVQMPNSQWDPVWGEQLRKVVLPIWTCCVQEQGVDVP